MKSGSSVKAAYRGALARATMAAAKIISGMRMKEE